MNNFTSQVLSSQLQASHGLLKMTMDGVTDEIAAFAPPGVANSIASTYAHIVLSEDFLINTLLQGKKALFETEWLGKTGASDVQPMAEGNSFPKWIKGLKVNIQQMDKYAEVVFAESEKYVASLSDENLKKEVNLDMFGLGNQPFTFIIGSVVINNLNTHLGEISAIKGIQGLKGYPV